VIGMAGEHEVTPFTPFGGDSLSRMANLHANILQIGGGIADFQAVVAARLLPPA
jgi:hypothetical protein